MKNLLSAVIAMASLSGRLSASPTEYREALLARLQALFRAHGLLSGNDWTQADVSGVVKRHTRAVPRGWRSTLLT